MRDSTVKRALHWGLVAASGILLAIPAQDAHAARYSCELVVREEVPVQTVKYEAPEGTDVSLAVPEEYITGRSVVNPHILESDPERVRPTEGNAVTQNGIETGSVTYTAEYVSRHSFTFDTQDRDECDVFDDGSQQCDLLVTAGGEKDSGFHPRHESEDRRGMMTRFFLALYPTLRLSAAGDEELRVYGRGAKSIIWKDSERDIDNIIADFEVRTVAGVPRIWSETGVHGFLVDYPFGDGSVLRRPVSVWVGVQCEEI